MIIGRGTLEGRSGHEMHGSFTLTRTEQGLLLATGEDFFFDGSPAPGFALSANGVLTQAQAVGTDFHRLPGSGVSVKGQQSAVIPPKFNLDEFDALFLWCFVTPVLLGVGPIVREK